jgi:hypothetical protein
LMSFSIKTPFSVIMFRVKFFIQSGVFLHILVKRSNRRLYGHENIQTGEILRGLFSFWK